MSLKCLPRQIRGRRERFCLDFVIVLNDKMFVIECNEQQHDRAEYPVLEESQRPRLAREVLSLRGNTMPIVWINFNPHEFRICATRMNVPRKLKYDRLNRVIRKYCEEADIEQSLSELYLYYDNTPDEELKISKMPEFGPLTLELITENITD